MLTSVVHVRIPAKLVQPMRAEAHAREVSVSELIRQAIMRELAVRAGLGRSRATQNRNHACGAAMSASALPER